MNEQTEVVYDAELIANPASQKFSDRWHAEKLLKRSKKKARKSLEQRGFSKSQASKMVKTALTRITTNSPERRGSGRGG